MSERWIRDLESVDWFNTRRLFEAIGDIPPPSTKRATMPRPQWPDAHNSLSEIPGRFKQPNSRQSDMIILKPSEWLGRVIMMCGAGEHKGGEQMMAVNRERFVRVVALLGVLVLAALLSAMVLLPDRLARIAELFLDRGSQ